MGAPKGRQRRPLSDRFWEKVNSQGENDCWWWIASLDTRGYGSIGADGGKPLMRAHRVAYQLMVGPIPPGLVVAIPATTVLALILVTSLSVLSEKT